MNHWMNWIWRERNSIIKENLGVHRFLAWAALGWVGEKHPGASEKEHLETEEEKQECVIPWKLREEKN